MTRSDMSDFEWNFVTALLPNKPRGVNRVDDRRVINGRSVLKSLVSSIYLAIINESVPILVVAGRSETTACFVSGFPYSSHHPDPVSPLQQKANANDFKTERQWHIFRSTHWNPVAGYARPVRLMVNDL